MPCSAAGCGCASRSAAIASATTPSCLRPRPQRSPATGGRIRRGRRRRGSCAGACAVAEVDVTLVEIDPELAAHRRGERRAQRPWRARARRHARRDGVGGRIRRARHRPGSADRVLMNPPFNDPARQNVSPDPARRAAHAAGDGLLPPGSTPRARLLHSRRNLDADLARRWIGRGARRAWRRASAALRCCRFTAAPARLRSASWCAPRKGSRAPLALLPGLMLNDETGADRGGGSGAARRAGAAAGGD